MFVKRFAVTGAAVLSVLVMGACSGAPGAPAAAGTLSCGGGSFRTAVAPGIAFTPRDNTLTATPSLELACSDGTGVGITSGRIEDFSLAFPLVGCSGSDDLGQGAATVRWSDGSTSAAQVFAVLDTPMTGRFQVSVVDGHFAGYVGLADFSVSASTGDCFSGITGTTITIGALTFRVPAE